MVVEVVVVVRVRWWQQLCGGDVREIGRVMGPYTRGVPVFFFFYKYYQRHLQVSGTKQMAKHV